MPRKNNDHVSHYSEETNVETNAGLVMRIYRIVPHIHSAVFSTLYMYKKSAIDILLVSNRISVFCVYKKLMRKTVYITKIKRKSAPHILFDNNT